MTEDRTPGTNSPNRQGTSHTFRELYEQGRETREHLDELSTAARQVMESGSALLRERMQQTPYTTVAAAAGVGFILGGGLSPAIVRLLLVMGGRVAFEMLLHRGAVESRQETP